MRALIPVWDGVSTKENTVLKALAKATRHFRLASQFAGARGQIDAHIGEL